MRLRAPTVCQGQGIKYKHVETTPEGARGRDRWVLLVVPRRAKRDILCVWGLIGKSPSARSASRFCRYIRDSVLFTVGRCKCAFRTAQGWNDVHCMTRSCLQKVPDNVARGQHWPAVVLQYVSVLRVTLNRTPCTSPIDRASTNSSPLRTSHTRCLELPRFPVDGIATLLTAPSLVRTPSLAPPLYVQYCTTSFLSLPSRVSLRAQTRQRVPWRRQGRFARKLEKGPKIALALFLSSSARASRYYQRLACASDRASS